MGKRHFKVNERLNVSLLNFNSFSSQKRLVGLFFTSTTFSWPKGPDGIHEVSLALSVNFDNL